MRRRQDELLEFIIDFQIDQGRPPRVRELARALDYRSLEEVRLDLASLVAAGVVDPRILRDVRQHRREGEW